jgi:uncharacterized Zn finger protein (UPF0148 family)
MTTPTTWRTDDPCPVCGTGLLATDDGHQLAQDCPLCGWSATWQTDKEGGTER